MVKYNYKLKDIEFYESEVVVISREENNVVIFKLIGDEKIALGRLNAGKIRRLSPFVANIKYDYGTSSYFITDSLSGSIIDLSFFVDENGEVMGTGYTNDSNQILEVKTTGKFDTYPFETYDNYKIYLESNMIIEKKRIAEHNKLNAVTMVNHSKRKLGK